METDELSPALSDHPDSDENDETVSQSQATDEDILQAKRLLYVETLLRNHLKFVTYPALPPPNNADTLVTIRTEILLRWAEDLEEIGDVVAAILIVAALNVERDGGDGDVTAIVDEFLQSALGTFLDNPTTGTEFLYTVLGELTQRETDDGDNQADLSDGESTSPCFSLPVLIGTQTIPVPFDQLLPFFWSPDDRLATDCHACALPFVGGDPPIRTINIAMDDDRILEVRVFNRHFACIKDSHIPFVPVSHVWADSIRHANVDRAHNDAAATKLISTLMDLGMGAEGAYDPGVEFWHDYFSVPQWQAQVKEQLLVRLPAIYQLPDEILVHLDDVSSMSMRSLLLGPCTKMADNDPLLEVMTVLPHIRGLFGSEWMSRMWVTLEYAQCRAACVMTNAGRIHRLLDHDAETQTVGGLYARDTFSHALTIAHNYLRDILRYACSIGTSLRHLTEFLSGPGWRSRFFQGPPHRLLLGEAIALVASKQCQYSRDRFIALDVLLGGQRTEWLPAGEAVLPGPQAEACAHVWLKALRQGDWSPLLLQPRERIPGSNPSTQSGLASWLVGHLGLDGVEWGYGRQLSPSDVFPAVTDEGTIRATLVLAGEIEGICYLDDVQQSDAVSAVAFGLHQMYGVAKADGMELSPELLGDGLQRIFPSPDISGENLWDIDRLSSIADADRRDPEVADRIRCLLAEYDGAGDESNAAQVAQGISCALGLEEGIFGPGKAGKNLTRLGQSKGLAYTRERRGAKWGDPICKVRCPECRRVTPFRLDLRETGGIGQKVYRIPGLTYYRGIKHGVGLVLGEEGRITGRMFYGPPACDCRLLVEVEIH